MIQGLTSLEVCDLAWAFQGPGLLNPSCFHGHCLADSDLREIFRPHLKQLEELNADPRSLLEFLIDHPNGNRLGRHFENLILYFLTRFKNVSQIESNLAIRDGRKTIGELDFIFREIPESTPLHFEVSVKFYVCIARDLEESLDCRSYAGTLIEDRLDRKIQKIFEKQLILPQNPAAARKLESLKLANPISLGLMKGCIFYPSTSDWQNHPHPVEVSEMHHRGWWTPAENPVIPQKSERSRYVILPFDRWLTPFQGPLGGLPLYTHSEIQAYIARIFDNSWARPLHFDLGIAEVEGEEPRVFEISRGNILHPKWFRHATENLDRSI